MSQEAAVKDLTDTILNGVNVDAIFRAIALLGSNPEAARFKFRNRNRWISGGLNRSFINSYYGALEEHTRVATFVLDNDEPPVLLGEDRGANPVEQVLHGLAGCITTTLVYHAVSKGIKIDEIRGRPRSQGSPRASGREAKRLRRDKGERQDQVRRREGGDRGACEARPKTPPRFRHSLEPGAGEGEPRSVTMVFASVPTPAHRGGARPGG